MSSEYQSKFVTYPGFGRRTPDSAVFVGTIAIGLEIVIFLPLYVTVAFTCP